MTDCGVVCRTSSLGENHVGVPGCEVVGSTAEEIRGAHEGICTGCGQSVFVAAGSADAAGTAGAHDGRGDAGANDEGGLGAAGETAGVGAGGVEATTGVGAGGVEATRGVGAGDVDASAAAGASVTG